MKLNHKDLSSPAARSSSPSDRNKRSSSPVSTTTMASSPPSSPPSQHNEDSENKGAALDSLLAKCAQFTNILADEGSDGNALGQHSLSLAEQPKCMVGGIMRDYQLEGLTWMFKIAGQGMSGILADEMGLGKTIQTISLLAKLRDVDVLGPHLIVAPLSTLSNWMDEFEKWTPNIPVVQYHGNPKDRKDIFRDELQKNLEGGVTPECPIVLTTPEIILRDAKDLRTIGWDMIIVVSQLTISTHCLRLTAFPGRRPSIEELRSEVFPSDQVVQVSKPFFDHRNTSPEQLEGTLVSVKLSHPRGIYIVATIRVVV